MMWPFNRRSKPVPVMPEVRKSFLERWIGTMETSSKQLLWFLMLHACFWIDLSYLLAWCGREQIAEALSTTVCTTILGAIIAYLTTSTVQNISKYNPKFGGSPAPVPSTNYEEPMDPDEDVVLVEPDNGTTDEPSDNEEEVVG